jgi:uncharacterized protein (TIGR02145 family)
MKKLFFLFITQLATGLIFAQNVSVGHTVPVARLDIRGVSNTPSIPGTSSTGVVRIGISSNEAIDIGKMSTSPYIGWIQAGFNGVDTDPLSLQPLGGNVGIGTGTSDPGAKLHINGTLKVTDGTQGVGKILTSDATGMASWQPPPTPPGTNDPSVSICCQRWMIKNLDVAMYKNGDPIPKVTNSAAWAALTTGAYCYYNNDSATYAATYGKLYNWYAVNDPRGLAPAGWYIPTDFEYTTLGSCLGGNAVAGGPMKEIGTTHWAAPNTGATNLSGFTGLPGGYRSIDGSFANISLSGLWWSSTEDAASHAYIRYLFNTDAELYRTLDDKRFGFSVRCLRD